MTLFAYPVRLAAFGVTVGLVYAGLHQLHLSAGDAIGRENGPIEVAQVVFAVLAVIGFVVAAVRTRVGRVGLAGCGVMLAYAAARESDSLFEAYFFDDAYKYMVGLPGLAVLAAVAWAGRGAILRETLVLLNQPAATIFILAGIYLAFVCQSLDRPAMWSATQPTTKIFIEETVELFAYMTFAFSASEAIWFARRSGAMVAAEIGEGQSKTFLKVAA